MGLAEFEEKEYEQAANVELGVGGGFLMSPGQVLEELVGYDAVAAPIANHVIWQLLNHPRPRGVRLLPGHWAPPRRPPAYRLPQHPVSLMLQYKRPEYLRGPRAAQWRYWQAPYFRFKRAEDQHRVLRRLDRSLESSAVVRYAAPAFWRFADLEAAAVTRQVLKRTGFVRPMELKHHRVWTYVEPGVEGRANPSGRRLNFEDIRELTRLLIPSDTANTPLRRDEPIDRLAEHISGLAQVCRDREPRLRSVVDGWAASVSRYSFPLTAGTVSRLADLATVVTLTSWTDTTWVVADRLDPLNVPD